MARQAKKILIVADDAGESYEILYATHRFQEAGFQTVLAASKKKTLNGVIHDFYPGWNTYAEKPGYLIQADASFAQIKSKDFEGVVILGGRAPEFLRHNKKLVQLIRELNRDNKWLMAICHGIQVLIAAGAVEGKKVTCYEHVRFEVAAAGGRWINRPCVVDGRLITAQTWESHPHFYRTIFEQISR